MDIMALFGRFIISDKALVLSGRVFIIIVFGAGEGIISTLVTLEGIGKAAIVYSVTL